MVDSPLTLVVQSSQLTSWFSPKKAPLRHLQMSRALLRCTEHASRGTARHHVASDKSWTMVIGALSPGISEFQGRKEGWNCGFEQKKLPLASVGSSSCHVYNPEKPSSLTSLDVQKLAAQKTCPETCHRLMVKILYLDRPMNLKLLSCIDLHLPSALRPTMESLVRVSGWNRAFSWPNPSFSAWTVKSLSGKEPQLWWTNLSFQHFSTPNLWSDSPFNRPIPTNLPTAPAEQIPHLLAARQTPGFYGIIEKHWSMVWVLFPWYGYCFHGNNKHWNILDCMGFHAQVSMDLGKLDRNGWWTLMEWKFAPLTNCGKCPEQKQVQKCSP